VGGFPSPVRQGKVASAERHPPERALIAGEKLIVIDLGVAEVFHVLSGA
jgi:hypothetical protein